MPAHSNATNIPSPEICVICLDLLVRSHITSSSGFPDRTDGENDDDSNDARPVATALPCQHAQFHQSCLGTWLSRSPSCPLCKTDVLSISLQHDSGSPEIINVQIKPSRPPPTPSASRPTCTQPIGHPPRRPPRLTKGPIHEDPILTFRRQLYTHRIPSLYLGRGITTITTRSSSANATRTRQPLRRRITPASLAASSSNPDRDALLQLATIWIRRELLLFPFLHPTSIPRSDPSPSDVEYDAEYEYMRPPHRRTTASFLLPYLLSILQSLDLKGAAGQAQTLVSEYLGAGNAALFCHELHAFLSSGVGSVWEWDGMVQYWFPVDGGEAGGGGALRAGTGEVLGRVG